ncbi:MAG: transposase [Blastocatellia bacterium]|nr:transposase [Blastocatellia bacterium]
MPRIPRHQSAPGAMRPGTLYHVTSHAVAGTWLFETARDRVVFLSLLAWQCRERGLVVHAFCCMSNHVHLVVEDRRGQLSQAMSLVKSLYARYYNATRPGGRRRGALWAERFSAEVIDTKRYYDAAVAYVLLNPVRVKTPMVASPEVYPWSSCAMTVGEGVTPTAYFARMVEKEGGIDAILDSMPKARNPAAEENRRRRLEILVEGREFVVDGVLGGRSREEYLDHLRAKMNAAAIEFHEAEADSRERQKESNADMADGADRLDPTEAHIGSAASAKSALLSPLRLSSLDIPRAAPQFTGLSKTVAIDAILGKLSQWLPVPGKRRSEVRQVEAWALFRFTGFGMRKIARLLRTTVDEVEEAIRSVRALREKERAWWRAIWNAEWSLRWSLAAAPWRD